jgi:hypothetical protein
MPLCEAVHQKITRHCELWRSVRRRVLNCGLAGSPGSRAMPQLRDWAWMHAQLEGAVRHIQLLIDRICKQCRAVSVQSFDFFPASVHFTAPSLFQRLMHTMDIAIHMSSRLNIYGTKMNSSNFGFIHKMSNYGHTMHEGQNSLFVS